MREKMLNIAKRLREASVSCYSTEQVKADTLDTVAEIIEEELHESLSDSEIPESSRE